MRSKNIGMSRLELRNSKAAEEYLISPMLGGKSFAVPHRDVEAK
jgi:hypothetical protein